MPASQSPRHSTTYYAAHYWQGSRHRARQRRHGAVYAGAAAVITAGLLSVPAVRVTASNALAGYNVPDVATTGSPQPIIYPPVMDEIVKERPVIPIPTTPVVSPTPATRIVSLRRGDVRHRAPKVAQSPATTVGKSQPSRAPRPILPVPPVRLPDIPRPTVSPSPPAPTITPEPSASASPTPSASDSPEPTPTVTQSSKTANELSATPSVAPSAGTEKVLNEANQIFVIAVLHLLLR